MIQETQSSGDHREIGQYYNWYFSGGPEHERCHHGVAIVLDNRLQKYVVDIATINERIMILQFHGKVDIHFIAAFAPTAAYNAEDKDNFYETLTAEVKRRRRRGAVYTWAQI